MAKKSRVIGGGRKGIRAAFEDANLLLEEEAVPLDPDPHELRAGHKPGRWPGAPWSAMPPECPVTVVGHNGPITYVRSATGHLHEVDKLDRQGLAKLFAPYPNYMQWAWPRWQKAKLDEEGHLIPPQINGLEIDKAAICLINEGAKRGLFDPERQLRGRGGWSWAGPGSGHGGNLSRFIWHSGEYLWTAERGKLERAKPGQLGDHLYTRMPDLLRPWMEPVDWQDTPATRIFDGLKTWGWERPTLDPVLVLGWIMSGFMGGALHRRPIVFTTGGAGVGKSFLQGVLREIYGPLVFASSNTTAAAIYSHLKQDSRPAMIDELESKSGSAKAQAVIEIARVAYSGDSGHRGSPDGEGRSFNLFSSFFMSAINPPPMGTQDKTRMAVLNLQRVDRDRDRMEPVTVADYDGRMLLRQVMDGWDEFAGRLLPAWRDTLLLAGLDDRAADTYGTLLAAAELAIGAEALEEHGLPMAEENAAALGRMVHDATAVDRTEQVDNWQACIRYLFASEINKHRSGTKPTVGHVLADLESGKEKLDLKYAREDLAAAGLGIVPRDKLFPGEPGYLLAVPARVPQLDAIYADTDWHKGVWTSAMKQGPRDVVLRGEACKVVDPVSGKVSDRAVVKINRNAERCLLIDLVAFDKACGVAED